MELRRAPTREGDSARARRSRGSSMVEMAVVAPVLLLLLFAIAEFGVVFVQWQTISNAAREGARVAVVWRDPANNPDCVTQAQSDLTATVNSYASTTIAAPVTIDETSFANLCAGSGTLVTVTATAPYSFAALPGLAGVATNITLVGKSTMRNE